jgi:multiple RNA-binding domain-containing protein 1
MRLVVKNLPRKASETEIRQAFSEFGVVTEIKIMKKPDGTPRRFGFVGFRDALSGEAAIRRLNNTYLSSSKICVEEATPVITSNPVENRGHSESLKVNVQTALNVEALQTDDSEFLKGNTVAAWSEDEDQLSESKRIIDIVPDGVDGVLDSARLRILNLPYITKEDALTEFFSKYGPVRESHIVRDEHEKSKGWGFVSFVFPEHAVACLQETKLAGVLFEGRIIKVEEALTRSAQVEQRILEARTFKDAKLQKRKLNASSEVQSWNLLFVSASSAASASAAAMNINKSEILDVTASDLAIRASVAETELIKRTRDWLELEGIDINCFTVKGGNIQNASITNTAERDKSTIIIKHLPVEFVKEAELQNLFAKFGDLIKFSVSPSKTVAIAQYRDPARAGKAFTELAYSRYHSSPLYLEWAPSDVFTGEKNLGSAANEPARQIESVTLYVKNLNFATTSESLKKVFSSHRGFVNARLVLRQGPDRKTFSCGYGFVDFKDSESCAEALFKYQGVNLDGSNLQLRASEPKSRGLDSGNVGSERLIIRNVAFEATKDELRKLLVTYANVSQVRLPKKPDGNHRGFAFVTFASIADAQTAFQTLQNTHFYGRKLVIEQSNSSEPAAAV